MKTCEKCGQDVDDRVPVRVTYDGFIEGKDAAWLDGSSTIEVTHAASGSATWEYAKDITVLEAS